MYIKVKAFPGAGKETVTKVGDDTFRITVKEPAQAGAANKRIKTVLAQQLGVAESQVRLVKGHTVSSKIFQIL